MYKLTNTYELYQNSLIVILHTLSLAWVSWVFQSLPPLQEEAQQFDDSRLSSLSSRKICNNNSEILAHQDGPAEEVLLTNARRADLLISSSKVHAEQRGSLLEGRQHLEHDPWGECKGRSGQPNLRQPKKHENGCQVMRGNYLQIPEEDDRWEGAEKLSAGEIEREK